MCKKRLKTIHYRPKGQLSLHHSAFGMICRHHNRSCHVVMCVLVIRDHFDCRKRTCKNDELCRAYRMSLVAWINSKSMRKKQNTLAVNNGNGFEHAVQFSVTVWQWCRCDLFWLHHQNVGDPKTMEYYALYFICSFENNTQWFYDIEQLYTFLNFYFNDDEKRFVWTEFINILAVLENLTFQESACSINTILIIQCYIVFYSNFKCKFHPKSSKPIKISRGKGEHSPNYELWKCSVHTEYCRKIIEFKSLYP